MFSNSGNSSNQFLRQPTRLCWTDKTGVGSLAFGLSEFRAVKFSAIGLILLQMQLLLLEQLVIIMLFLVMMGRRFVQRFLALVWML